MVLITFICHLSLIGLEPVDLRLAACAVASLLRRRYVSLSAARPELRVQHGDAPFSVHEVGQRFGDRLARIDWTIADSNRRAARVITNGRANKRAARI
ncbi:hypothetical protein [Paraburkholderia sp. PGU19]|uniref:hypothetical protein n=1 Tax=Paraburkholderia sp. PGU19 TaxID=2735434 RepID=UPI0015D9F23B|nr:hypothetical protein [Paraburkholderia sp. PGU19]